MTLASPLPEAAAAAADPAIDRADGAARWDLVCLSHLRWDFVYQRPQHLMSRFARERRVVFVEEPIWGDGGPRLEASDRPDGVTVAVPHLPHTPHDADPERAQEELIRSFLAARGIDRYALWYYTPMALGFTRSLEPLAVIYDCMDELSLFAGAPPELKTRESDLMEQADLVFTGGLSLYEVKRERHPSVHPFPSSIDAAHFARARGTVPEPPDQAAIPRPRLGYFGVIDERMDLALLEGLATLCPDWQVVMLGPVVKIDPAALPRRANIHWLGMKPYAELPAYLAGWDVALMPFARNDSTRFISPTKTPEYLAGGRPVVATPLTDVVRPYGDLGLIEVAEEPREFAAAVERALALRTDGGGEWLARVDRFLAGNSWDQTFQRMSELIAGAVRAKGR